MWLKKDFINWSTDERKSHKNTIEGERQREHSKVTQGGDTLGRWLQEGDTAREQSFTRKLQSRL